jgi:hypothetical protein
MRLLTTNVVCKSFISTINSPHIQSQACAINSLPLKPSSFHETMHSSKAQYWHKAMDEEYDSLTKNFKWNLVSLLTMLKMLKSKWVYKIKTHFDGTIDHDKA